MTEWVDKLKEGIPDYAKDIRLNLDSVVKRSTLGPEETFGLVVAATFATGNHKLWTWIYSQSGEGEEWVKEKQAALTAASLMAMNNVWYPWVDMAADSALKGQPPGLRMNAIATHGGTTKARFEAYSLAASIVGKCNHCVRAHYDTLKAEGYTVEQLRDIGRIASVMAAVAKIMVG